MSWNNRRLSFKHYYEIFPLTGDAFFIYISLDNKLINCIMRNKVLLLALTSIMMSLYRPACAQESQSALKAGDIFTGTVTGRFGPIAGANIREYGYDGYIINTEVAYSLGRFSMTIDNPEHRFTVYTFLY